MRHIFRENSLSIVLFSLFLLCIVGQSMVGHHAYNDDQKAHGKEAIGYTEYISSNHFLEATMENWESEFLQMGFYVFLTAFLFQKGSSESKKPEEPSESERKAKFTKKANSPWPVRKGGFILKLYANSLSLTFLILFACSFVLHVIGGAGDYNEEQLEHGGQTVSHLAYLGTSRFWFESLQNWQSEFLAIGAMVVLTIFLRQAGSPESKPVESPHSQTGRG